MAAVSPPPNVDPVARMRNLSQLGCSVSVDNNVPPRRYLRSGLEMERMANIYFEEGNIEHAFILYNKLITLIVEKLPQHAHYKEVPATNRNESKKRVAKAFQKAETLKESLKRRYEEEFEAWKVEEAKKRKEYEMLEAEKVQQQEKEKEEQMKNRELEHRKQLEKERITNEQSNQMKMKTASENEHILSFPSVMKPVSQPSSFFLDTTSKLNETNEVERTAPSFDRGQKPMYSEFSHGLRTINVPSQLMRKFIEVASPNTRQNRETCGILAGKLRQNAFYITHLVIPKQTSTSDSCTTLNEEDIFIYQDSHDLITLGWIHTHPSQTAFMSSVDLHTHCSYQLMLPEALAIVCAPKHSQTGMFSLTNNHGLKYIAACRQQGFHMHPKEPPIYEDSSHVRLDETTSVTIADLR